VDYVIPGNDDALRAIRLFASKIADSVAEGAQLADKAMLEHANENTTREEIPQSFIGDDEEHGLANPTDEAAAAAAPAEAEGEEINMEEVLGKGVRKQPASENLEAAAAEQK
jgi:small subunit ribosomal protein S2